MNPGCGQCTFWQADELQQFGRCRRFPPATGFNQYGVHDRDRTAVFPRTVHDDWCGEFRVVLRWP